MATDLIRHSDGMITKSWARLPIDDDPEKSRANWQGATYAKNPKTGQGWLFQAQVNKTGPGDVEDLWIHRFSVSGNKLTYKDSMLIKRAGHAQTFHVRISIYGNPWVWVGVERYSKNKTVGTDLYRILYRRGRVTTASKDFQRIYTGPGSVNAISSPSDPKNTTVVLRRPESKTEVYEWHSEDTLRKWKSKTARPKPVFAMRVPREGGTFQSAAAVGNFRNAKTAAVIYRVNGATTQTPKVRVFQAVPGLRGVFNKLAGYKPRTIWNVASWAPTFAGRITSKEIESIFQGPNKKPMVGFRFNSTARRVVGYAEIGR